MVIDHKEPLIRTAETRVVSGKVTKTELGEGETIDGNEHVTHPGPGKTITQSKRWLGNVLVMHWELRDQKTRYISDINMSLSDDRQNLTMSEHYREPGLERIRDWVFERQ